MFIRAPLASISGNKTLRKELSLFDISQIAGLFRADLTLTQIHRNLNVPRIKIQSVLGRLRTEPSGINDDLKGHVERAQTGH